MKKQYDVIISIGEKCFTAQALRRLKLRQHSYPFDWIGTSYVGTGGNLADRLDLILHDFEGFFEKSDLHPVYEGESRHFVNTKTNLSFRHDFAQTDNFENVYDAVRDKYCRRCNRLLDLLKTNKKILLLFCSSLYPVSDKQQIIDKIVQINNKFNTNHIDLMVIESDANLKRNNAPRFRKINKNLYWVTDVDLYKPIDNIAPGYYINTVSDILKSHIRIKIPRNKTIISLTSFPARINTVHSVIDSLLKQNAPIDKVVLYLASNEFPDKRLPANLTDVLADSRFEIRWCEQNFKSYKKLIYALYDFPYANIITVDDDIIYPRNMARELLQLHEKHPDDICAHRVRKIKIQDGKIQNYRTWTLSEKRGLFTIRLRHSYTNFFCGCGGVLYPPKSLMGDVFDNEKFTTLCEHQDDVWFWAMAVLNNRKISVTRRGYDVNKRTIRVTQSVGLWQCVNSTAISPNNRAIENLIHAYPDIKNKLGLNE